MIKATLLVTGYGPLVKQILKERYGNAIPLEETVISPQDVFDSEVLETVTYDRID